MTEATGPRAGRRAGRGGRQRRAATVLGALVTTTMLAAGCAGSTGPSAPLALVARLVSFDSCDQLVGWFHGEAEARVSAYGLGNGASYATGDQMVTMQDSGASAPSSLAGGENSARQSGAESAASFSTTNVQEVGVGEPDLAVTDGSRLVTVVGGILRIVDLTGDGPVVTSQLEVPGGASQLLVDGDHALVIAGGWGDVVPMGRGGMTAEMAPGAGGRTSLTRVDLDGGAHIVGTIEVDADYVDARTIDGVARVVTRSGPDTLGFVYPSSGTSSAERRAATTNREIVADSTVEDWLPAVQVDGAERPAVDCAAVERPEDFSGFEVVTVLGLDLAAGATDLLPSTAVVAGAGTVYASDTSLYVATQRWPEVGDEGSDESGDGANSSPGTGAGAADQDLSVPTTSTVPDEATSSPVAPSAEPSAEPPAVESTVEPAAADPEPAPTTTTAPGPAPDPSSTTTSTPTTRPPTTRPPTTSVPSTSTTTSTTSPPATTTPDTTTPDTTVPLVPDLPAPEETGPFTDVHAFDITGRDAARYVASGRVRGAVLDQFSMSELDGRLRVSTTVDGWWMMQRGPDGPAMVDVQPPQSESFVTVLEPDGDALRRIGEVGGLGLGERIYSTRFVGALAYVVTFRQTDPLYVVDLRDPSAPVVAGELKIPGYSSYLQLVGEGRLLGVGQDATDTGRTTGFAESLFDVDDPTAPSRLAQLSVPGGHSLAEQDHHALLWWDATDTLVVPLTSWWGPAGPQDTTLPFNGVLVSTVHDTGIVERGRISHPALDVAPWRGPCPADADCSEPSSMPSVDVTPNIERSLVVGDNLVTVSQSGVMVNDLATLEQRSWTPFAG